MSFLLASPEPTAPVRPPAPVVLPEITPYDHRAQFPGLDSILWTGWNGDTWELWCRRPHIDRTGIALGRGIRGLDFPDVETWDTTSPALDGAQYAGYRVASREVFLNLRVYSRASSQEWIEWDRRFQRSFLPAAPGVRGPGRLTVVAPDGAARHLECFPIHDGSHGFEVDPSVRGYAQYGRTLIAHRPFWTTGPLPTRKFEAGGQVGFFGGKVGQSGAPFVIGGGATLGAAVIDNPGDEPAWPVWRLNGPFTQVRIGTPQQMTEITVEVAAGEWLEVDTDPLAQTVTDHTGQPRFPQAVTGAPFTPVPPGKNVPLVAEMVGDGSIEVTIAPLYHRAW